MTPSKVKPVLKFASTAIHPVCSCDEGGSGVESVLVLVEAHCLSLFASAPTRHCVARLLSWLPVAPAASWRSSPLRLCEVWATGSADPRWASSFRCLSWLLDVL